MSAEYGEWLERNDHPLLNHMILDKVFEDDCLSVEDLMECRLVCKAWSELIIPFTRRYVSRVTIHGNEPTKIHTIEKFVEVFRSNSFGIPFSRFRLGSFSTIEGVGQEFLQLCGNTTKEIDFLEDINICVEDVSELLKSTPKLKTFTIPRHLQSRSRNIVKLFPDPNSKPRLMSLKKFNVLYDHPKERHQCCPTFMEELIAAAENISSVTLRDSFGWHMLELGDIPPCTVEVLRVIENLGRESKILKLNILSNTNVEVVEDVFVLLRRMAEKGLKLRELTYKEVDDDFENSDNHTNLPQLISLFKKTIKVLCIRPTSLMGFPKMSCLTQLRLSFTGFREQKFNFKLGNLNEMFPVLESLSVFLTMSDDGLDEFEFFPDSDPCPTMKRLIVLFDIPFNNKTLNQMLNIFPNLTDLRISIRDVCADGLRQIWSQMTQLESLSLSGTVQTDADESLDSVFTGISTLALQGIREDEAINKLENTATEVERREILKLRTQHSPMQHPSIGNLTKLSSLSLKLTGNGIDGNGGTSPLTDLSGYLGFYSMESLKHLYVRDCELTESCCKMLTMDMELQSTLFRNEENKDIIPPVEYY